MHGINSIAILQWQKKAKPRHGNCTGGGAVRMSHKGGCPEPALSGAVVPNDRCPQEANSASWGGSERFLLVGVREAIFARRGEGTALRPWGGRAKG